MVNRKAGLVKWTLKPKKDSRSVSNCRPSRRVRGTPGGTPCVRSTSLEALSEDARTFFRDSSALRPGRGRWLSSWGTCCGLMAAYCQVFKPTFYGSTLEHYVLTEKQAWENIVEPLMEHYDLTEVQALGFINGFDGSKSTRTDEGFVEGYLVGKRLWEELCHYKT